MQIVIVRRLSWPLFQIKSWKTRYVIGKSRLSILGNFRWGPCYFWIDTESTDSIRRNQFQKRTNPRNGDLGGFGRARGLRDDCGRNSTKRTFDRDSSSYANVFFR